MATAASTPEQLAKGGSPALPLVQWRPFIVAVLLVAGTSGVVRLAFTPRYMVNDDMIMSLLVSGRGFSDVPDEHFVFSNFLIGEALKALYSTNPAVPWYGVYLLGVLVLSLTVLCYVFLRANPSRLQLLLSVVFLVAFAVPVLRNPQFTVIAFVASAAGLLLLVRAGSGRAGVAAWAVGAGLLILGSLMRFDSCGLACVVFAPAVGLAFLRSSRPRARRTLLLCLAGSLAVVGGLSYLNTWYYAASPGWENFYEYNALRSQIIDDGRLQYGRDAKPALDAVGWSDADLAMISHWSFADPERFSLAKLRTAVAAAPSGPPPPQVEPGQAPPDSTAAPPPRLWKGFVALVRDDTRLLLLLATGAACWLLMGGDRLTRAVPLLCLLAIAGVSAVCYFYHHLPQRVSWAMFAAFPVIALASNDGRLNFRPGRQVVAALFCLLVTAGVAALCYFSFHLAVRASWAAALPAIAVAYFAGQADFRPIRRVAAAAALALVGALTVSCTTTDLDEEPGRRARHARALEMIAQLAPRPDQLFVFWGDSFEYEDLDVPLEVSHIPLQLKAVGFNWLTPTPFTRRRLDEFGISDLYRALFERDDVLLVCQPRDLRFLSAYLEEHYGVRMEGRVVFTHPGLKQANVYRVCPLSVPPPEK